MTASPLTLTKEQIEESRSGLKELFSNLAQSAVVMGKPSEEIALVVKDSPLLVDALCDMALRSLTSGAEDGRDEGCICHGNWRLLVKESVPLFGRKYREDRTGDKYTFYGLVHADDDYYYGMSCKGKCRLLSCVGNIEDFGFTLIDNAIASAGGGCMTKSERAVVRAAMRAAADYARENNRPCSHRWGVCNICDATRWKTLMRFTLSKRPKR